MTIIMIRASVAEPCMLESEGGLGWLESKTGKWVNAPESGELGSEAMNRSLRL